MGLNEEGQVRRLKENTGQKVKNTTKGKMRGLLEKGSKKCRGKGDTKSRRFMFYLLFLFKIRLSPVWFLADGDEEILAQKRERVITSPNCSR